MKRRTLGELEAVVTDGDGPVVVLCHGFGAPGDDLVGLVPLLRTPKPLRFVFPVAPLAPPPLAGGRAWWMIDRERLQRGSRGPRDLNEIPPGLADARAQLSSLLEAVERELGVSGEQIVLGGFSQGAMLSLDVALHRASPLAGLVLLSGTLIAEREWSERLPARAGLPVFQSHGSEDPLLPFAVAETLRDKLTAAKLAVEWTPFRGGHEIPLPVLRGVGAFLGRVLP